MSIANEVEAVFDFGCDKLLVTKKAVTLNGEAASYIYFESLIGQEDELRAAKEVLQDEKGDKIIISRKEFYEMGDDFTSQNILELFQRQNNRQKWVVYKADRD